ncbi:MAG: S24/S26 family peptidase [Bacteroidales bacterium]|nr:S24/S26 family peptidase [Bacteroidales bacterium]
MNDVEIIKEAVKLVRDGISVTFPVKGRSMIPFIVGGKDSVILQQPGDLKPGVIVLAEISPEHYVLHRIIHIDEGKGVITLMGDGNVHGIEHCTPATVMARATHVVDPKGRTRSLESRGQQFNAKLWRLLQPFRRYILAILRRVCKKYAYEN